MKPTRWWEGGERSIADEVAWFEEDGLDFTLDEEKFEKDEVIFRGELRLGDRRTPAEVHYPTSYGSDGHPVVIAPELPVGRHRSPAGALCLDHPVFGETQPMCGAEAVGLAEQLWDFWENDREQLERKEANAPDPRSNYYHGAPEAALTLIDADLGEAQRGYFDVAAHSLIPLRGLVVGVRSTRPTLPAIEPPPAAKVLAGPVELQGAWTRVEEPPPFSHAEIADWLEENHRALLIKQAKYAKATGIKGTPALIGFVYPDEGPQHGESHDAWVVLAINPDSGQGQIVRTFHLRQDERWLRQPQLEPLAGKRVMLLGAGALGSQVADLLARAGIGGVLPTDFDIVTHGNRVRHELDLTDVGRNKADAIARRMLAVNPWIEASKVSTHKVGALDSDDEFFEDLAHRDLLINASAHPVTGKYVSALAAQAGVPVIHGWVTAGAWGGRILIQRPGVSGCWQCLGLAQTKPGEYSENVPVPPVATDPAMTEVNERGCADPSFTGPGFELAAAAAAMARIVIQVLLDGDGYPPADFDLATVNFRDADSACPDAVYTRLPPHPSCPSCGTG